MNHPYMRYEHTRLWRAIDAELAALAANGDLQLTTARQYVIGSLCKTLVIRRLVVPEARSPKAATPRAAGVARNKRAR